MMRTHLRGRVRPAAADRRARRARAGGREPPRPRRQLRPAGPVAKTATSGARHRTVLVEDMSQCLALGHVWKLGVRRLFEQVDRDDRVGAEVAAGEERPRAAARCCRDLRDGIGGLRGCLGGSAVLADPQRLALAQADDHVVRRRLSLLGCLLGWLVCGLLGWLVGCPLGWLLGDSPRLALRQPASAGSSATCAGWLLGDLGSAGSSATSLGWLFGNLVGDLLGRLVGTCSAAGSVDLLWRSGLSRFSRLLERRNWHLRNRRHLELGEVLHGGRGRFAASGATPREAQGPAGAGSSATDSSATCSPDFLDRVPHAREEHSREQRRGRA